jgi:hypothetical protein
MNNLCHIELLPGVSAFELGGERANTRTLQEENNTRILVNKIPL